MDILDCIRAFVATAETGSFTAAAERLSISNRLTSKYVAELERRLGTRLLQRTTRAVGLTAAGQTFYDGAPALIQELDGLLASVSQSRVKLAGHIRVSAPMDFGSAYIKDMLGRFMATHRGISIELQLDDRYVDLARHGIDLAFRIGEPDLQSFKVRRLGEVGSIPVAAPGYIAQRGTPVRLADLADHDCIIDTNRRNGVRWSMTRGDTVETIQVQGRFYVNSAKVAAEMAAEGLGIALCPHFAVAEKLRTGALVALFPDFDVRKQAFNIVYLEGRTVPPTLRALIEFAVQDAKRTQMF